MTGDDDLRIRIGRGPVRWHPSENAESTLRALGEQNDIIKRIHRGLAEQRIERSVSDYVLDHRDRPTPVIGRLVARGLDDELNGTAYAVVDGTDERLVKFFGRAIRQAGTPTLNRRRA